MSTQRVRETVQLENEGRLVRFALDDWLEIERRGESRWSLRVLDQRLEVELGAGTALVSVERTDETASRPRAGRMGKRWTLVATSAGVERTVEDEGRFDELAIDDWFHAEVLDKRLICVRVADARILVDLRRREASTADVERDFYEA